MFFYTDKNGQKTMKFVTFFLMEWQKDLSEGFGNEVKRRIMLGTYVLSSGYYDAYYKKAQKVRSLLIASYWKLLSKYDAILSPVTPTMPTKFGELINDPVKNMMADLYTVIVNIVGLPSLSLPCGFSKEGYPIGMQLIGAMFTEENLFTLGHAYQQIAHWHTKNPVNTHI